jgi:hypothetical protein
MNLWTWVLIALCALALLLAVSSAIVVLLGLKRLRARVNELQSSRLALSLRSLQMESARFQQLEKKISPLRERAGHAASSIRESAQSARLPQAKAAMQKAGEDIAALMEDLR